MVHQTTDKKPLRVSLSQKRKKTVKKKPKTKAKNIYWINEFELSPFSPAGGFSSFGQQKKVPVRFIVLHTTGTQTDKPEIDLDRLPYHFVITRSGRLVNLKELKQTGSTVEIALIGGMDKEGNHCDTRTEKQNEVLFRTLVMLTELFPKAEIIGADQIYVYSHANPGFDLKDWLSIYIPDFLQSA